jgi:hypothetical protein
VNVTAGGKIGRHGAGNNERSVVFSLDLQLTRLWKTRGRSGAIARHTLFYSKTYGMIG